MEINKENNLKKIPKTYPTKSDGTTNINDALIINLRNLSHTMRSLYEGKGSQKRILIILSETGKITQKELTEYLGIRPGSASEVISKLVTAGYIIKSMSESDRRTMNIELSEEGKTAALEAINQRKQRHEEMFFCLSDDEKNTLLSLLETINSDWENRYQEKVLPHMCRHHGNEYHHKRHLREHDIKRG